jgi:hypothetical protein
MDPIIVQLDLSFCPYCAAVIRLLKETMGYDAAMGVLNLLMKEMPVLDEYPDLYEETVIGYATYIDTLHPEGLWAHFDNLT